MRNISKLYECGKTLLQYMFPVGKGKNYSRFDEFRQIICPLNKHRQNKQTFGKIFKIQVFEVYINNNSCNFYTKISKKPLNKGE